MTFSIVCPQDHTVLLLLMRMLSLGLDAWRIMKEQEFKEPKLDPQVRYTYTLIQSVGLIQVYELWPI